ncbi:uncharacterized protein LOC121381131 isoform X4 [Gigantopelta aegis]|uniref:uncharacterized protein LOC121381131 isoform X4 n=1 Tax=Gigantopelta aegis TaxID=1735272 RepID=UPI001B88B2A6|nr:uncharacterized protein LOC121381131 isoform X4 [Gigantopelta aegis]
MKLFAVAIYISFGVLIPYVGATTCEECKIAWYNSDKTCADDTTYIKCLLAAADTDAGCDTRHTRMAEAKDHRDGINPTCTALTGTCICEIAYARVDVSAAATKCTKLKEEMNCLMSAIGFACDGSTKKSAVATTQDGLIVASCRTGLTDTCKCQIDYAKVDVTVAADKCTGAKNAIKCLVAATDAGCTAAVARKDTVAAINTIVTNTASCDLTDTCKCETAYAMADVTAAADKCTAAKTATTCLEAIKSAEEKACDGSTLTKTYLNETITPIVTEACSSGTVVLLSVWVAAACVLSGMIQQ